MLYYELNHGTASMERGNSRRFFVVMLSFFLYFLTMNKVIDSHTHVFPDAIAPRAVEYMETHSGTKLSTDGTVSGLRRSMDEAGIEQSVLLPVASKPDNVKSINDFSISVTSDDLVPFGTLHPAFVSFADELKRLSDSGIRGVKMHPDHQSFAVDDPRAFPVYEALQNHDMVLYLHSGKNLGIPEALCKPEQLSVVIDMFPELRVVAAHMGGWRMWDDVNRFLVGKDLWLDISFVSGELDDDVFLDMITRHGISRILFGSDSPWVGQKRTLDAFLTLPLPESDRQMVLAGNIGGLLNL